MNVDMRRVSAAIAAVEAGKSRTESAKAAGVSTRTLRYWIERGRRQGEHALFRKLAEVAEQGAWPEPGTACAPSAAPVFEFAGQASEWFKFVAENAKPAPITDPGDAAEALRAARALMVEAAKAAAAGDSSLRMRMADAAEEVLGRVYSTKTVECIVSAMTSAEPAGPATSAGPQGDDDLVPERSAHVMAQDAHAFESAGERRFKYVRYVDFGGGMRQWRMTFAVDPRPVEGCDCDAGKAPHGAVFRVNYMGSEVNMCARHLRAAAFDEIQLSSAADVRTRDVREAWRVIAYAELQAAWEWHRNEERRREESKRNAEAMRDLHQLGVVARPATRWPM